MNQGRKPSVRPASPSSRKLRPTEVVFGAFVRRLEENGLCDLYTPFRLHETAVWNESLSRLLSDGLATFEALNREVFGSTLPTPAIGFVARSTGGFYRHHDQTIGISLAMTIEFGATEFHETLLHEIAHMRIRDHSAGFHYLLKSIGGTGRRAPQTMILKATREKFQKARYPILVACPHCKIQRRYKTRRALRYACRRCCDRFARGKYDTRFKLLEVQPDSSLPEHVISASNPQFDSQPLLLFP